MFTECHTLTSLDISNFETSQITTMSSLFKNCYNLLSLNFSSFDTSNIENMEYMFSGCSSLSSLDLNNFNMNSITSLNYIFNDCIRLDYIILPSNIDLNHTEIISIFLNNTNDNIVICLNRDNATENQLMEILSSKLCPKIYCGNDWRYKRC